MLPMPRGRAATPEAVEAILRPLATLILQEHRTLGFSPTLRGWCYSLEGLGVCTKGDFNDVMTRITMMRKRGILPLNITAEDTTRQAHGGVDYVSLPLPHLMRRALQGVRYDYGTTRLVDFSGVHIELVVEKLDLVEMLKGVAYTYRVPITCVRGWADMHSRAAILQRCAEYDRNVILMFGDHDVGGLSITTSFKANLDEVLIASRLEEMPNIESIERLGLNADDIERLGLVWIDGLETSSGKDLSDPRHSQHKNADVQRYLQQFGARKVEANALLRNPKAAVEIAQAALRRLVPDSVLEQYRVQCSRDMDAADEAIEIALAALEGSE